MLVALIELNPELIAPKRLPPAAEPCLLHVQLIARGVCSSYLPLLNLAKLKIIFSPLSLNYCLSNKFCKKNFCFFFQLRYSVRYFKIKIRFSFSGKILDNL